MKLSSKNQKKPLSSKQPRNKNKTVMPTWMFEKSM